MSMSDNEKTRHLEDLFFVTRARLKAFFEEEIKEILSRWRELESQGATEKREPPLERNVYMVLVNQTSGCVFVKELDFYRSQGGFKQTWGLNWIPIVATSIEDARKKGCSYPGAKPYEQQAV